MKTINVSQAEGPVLDWLVAKADTNLHPIGDVRLLDGRVFSINAGDYERSDRWQQYSPSTDWAQGGPIIEREWLHVEPWPNASVEERRWSCTQYELPVPIGTLGPTPLIAAMRCYVASKLGEIVEVPKELK